MKKRIQRAANATIKKARCLAGFSGSVAQLRFACLPQAARVSESRPRIVRFAHRVFWIGLFSFATARLKPVGLVGLVGQKIGICTDLYGFVRICTEGDNQIQSVFSPYPSVPICTNPYSTKKHRRQMSVAKLSRPIQKRCYAPFIRSIRKGSGRVGLAYWMAGSPKSIAASIRYPRGRANFFLRDGISRNA